MCARLVAVHPVLVARDVRDSLSFYLRLGFRVIFEDDPDAPRYAAVERDGCELHLQWHDASQWEWPGDRPVYRFLVTDPDSLFEELRRQGALPADLSASGSPWSEPRDTPWGTREFHLRDPADNGLQFYALREPL